MIRPVRAWESSSSKSLTRLILSFHTDGGQTMAAGNSVTASVSEETFDPVLDREGPDPKVRIMRHAQARVKSLLYSTVAVPSGGARDR